MSSNPEIVHLSMYGPSSDVSEHPCTLSLWREVPGKQDGKPCQKVVFYKLLPTYQGYLQCYGGHFAEGPGGWGQGLVLDPFWQGNYKMQKLLPRLSETKHVLKSELWRRPTH
jgi:hypothetical protein